MILDEQKLISIAEPYYQSARSGDWEHAKRVVKWVKELGKDREDLDLLIVAGYIHDIGWSGVAPAGKIDLKEMLALEPQANANSKVLVQEVVKNFDHSNADLTKINRLIAAADAHRAHLDDEAIIVDADTLSKLCIEHLQEKYQPESFNNVIRLWQDKLAERVVTDKAKKLFPKMLEDLKSKVTELRLY